MTKSNTLKDGVKETPEPKSSETPAKVEEIGGREGLDPVRYGDWEIGGRCVDF